jgi:hypothetical protein
MCHPVLKPSLVGGYNSAPFYPCVQLDLTLPIFISPCSYKVTIQNMRCQYILTKTISRPLHDEAVIIQGLCVYLLN